MSEWIYDLGMEPNEREEVLVAVQAENGNCSVVLAWLNWGPTETDGTRSLTWCSTFDGSLISQIGQVYGWSTYERPVDRSMQDVAPEAEEDEGEF